VVQNTEDAIDLQLNEIDNLYGRIEEVAIGIMLRQEINAALQSYNGVLSADGIEQYNYIKDQLKNVMISRSDINEIILFSKDFDYSQSSEKGWAISVNSVVNSKAIMKQEWYKRLQEQPNLKIFAFSDLLYSTPTRKSGEIVFAMNYKDINQNLKIGTILIFVDNRQIENIISGFNQMDRYNIIMLDSFNNVISKQVASDDIYKLFEDEAGIILQSEGINWYEEKMNSETYLIANGYSERTGFSLKYAIPKSIMLTNIFKIRIITFIIILACILLSVLAIITILTSFLKPLMEIEKTMVEVENGALEARSGYESENEIGRLAVRFNTMVDSVQDMNRKMIEEEAKKRSYEIRALQAQINPHFLYNTLDSIRWTAMTQENETIEKMSSALIGLLRKTISSNDEFVLLEEEIDNLEDYVAIEKIRYCNSFDYQTHIDPQIKGCIVPKLILQPLVENALFHGIYGVHRRGVIEVTVKRKNSDVYIFVTDNGKGMTDVSHNMKAKNDVKFSGIGINNIDERIKLYYGEEYGLTFETKINRYTTAIIHIPYRSIKPGEDQDV
jgi:two-component system sensor histidine kinase YesM